MMGELTKCKADRRYPVEDFRAVHLDGGFHVNANPGFSFATHGVIYLLFHPAAEVEPLQL